MSDTNEKPMSDAERAKAYRERKKKKTVTLSRVSREQLDEIMKFYQLEDEQQLVNDLLEVPLLRALEGMHDWWQSPELADLRDRNLSSEDQEVINTLKRIVWRSVCAGGTFYLPSQQLTEEKVEIPDSLYRVLQEEDPELASRLKAIETSLQSTGTPD